MKVEQLYDFITDEMTAEQALKLLLKSSLLNYEKLKFNKGEEIHPIILVSYCAFDMDWQIAVEKDQEDVHGLMIGNEDYMNKYNK